MAFAGSIAIFMKTRQLTPPETASGLAHWDFLCTLSGPTEPINWTLKAIGVCMGVWFDGFLSLKITDMFKKDHDFSYHKYSEANL